MRKNWKNNLVLGGMLILFVLLASCNRSGDHAEHADTYTCPMHPTVISDKPGTCPVCGMDLVRKARPGEEVKLTEDLSRLMKSPNQAVVSSIKTIKPSFKSMPVSVEATGIVTYDTRNVYTIPSRVAGRVEKMFVKYEFESIRKGQKIAEIYSPELITAQRELLFLMENDNANEVLVDGARRKLELLGLSTAQLDDLMKRKQPTNVFAVYSAYHGYVITNDTAPSASPTVTQQSSGGMDGMGVSSSPGSAPSAGGRTMVPAALVREGDYVSAGQALVKLVNTNALRIELDLPVAQAGLISVGDKIELNFESERKETASVDFVQPFFNQGQNFIKVRVYVRGGKSNYIGQLVRATINIKSQESLWVPTESVLNLGTDQVVFVKDHDVLKPKKVSTGIETNEWIAITSGLASTDEIASNAQYLVDSESFIKPIN